MTSHIYIIGAGAIGKSLAVFLQSQNRHITLIHGSKDNIAVYTENTSVILPDGSSLSAKIEISSLSNFSSLEGLIVLTNKSFGNPQIAGSLKGKTKQSPIILLQNGLGVEQPFLDQHFPEIYRCVLFVTSQHSSPGTLSFKPVAASQIGSIRQQDSSLDTIVQQLNTPGFPFVASTDIQPIIWKKAIINCAFNSICPLLDIDNGIFHRDPAALAIASEVITECLTIAHAKDIPLNKEEVLQGLLNISRSSDGQLISTLQDIKNGRQTEIDTLNFEIARIAATLDMTHLVQRTSLLGELTKTKAGIGRDPH